MHLSGERQLESKPLDARVILPESSLTELMFGADQATRGLE